MNMDQMDLAVDGTDEYGSYSGDGKSAPFVIFDINRQENIAGPFSTRQQAEAAKSAILNGERPRLDVQQLMAYLDRNSQLRVSPPSWDAESLCCFGMILLSAVLPALFIAREWNDFTENVRLALIGSAVLAIIIIVGVLLTDFSGSERHQH